MAGAVRSDEEDFLDQEVAALKKAVTAADRRRGRSDSMESEKEGMAVNMFLEWVASLGAVFIDLLRLAVAFALAVPIGWNREREVHSAGIRTFPIVAIASCGLVLAIKSIPGATAETYSRVLQGLVTGIGFVGGGAILKDKGSVSGTATAASVWNIGIVGAAVGMGAYHIAVVLSLVNFLTLKLMLRWKKELDGAAGVEGK